MKRTVLQLIPYVLAAVLVLTHIIQVLTSSSFLNDNGELSYYSFVDSVLYASLGLAITLVFILLKKSYWKYVFLGVILLSLTEFVEFYPVTFTIGIGVLSIEMTSLGLLIFHITMNPDMISSIRLKIKPSEKSIKEKEEHEVQRFEANVNHFIEKFASKQRSELERIVNEQSLIPEAIEAARRLLNNTST